MNERLTDRRLMSFVTASDVAEVADEDQWTVVLDEEGTPSDAVPPGGRTRPAQLVIADATTPTDQALASPAFKELDPDTPVVVMRHGTVVGVWAGEDLDSAMMLGPSRLSGDAAQPGAIQLPGRIRIPEIRRRCRYVEATRACDNLRTFTEKPETMPMCSGRLGLADHRFVW